MSAQRVSIGHVMMIVALAAVNLAVTALAGLGHIPPSLGCSIGIYRLPDHLEADPAPIASSLSLHVPDRLFHCFLRHGEPRRDGAAPSSGPPGPLVPTPHGRENRQQLAGRIPQMGRVMDGLFLELYAGVCDRIGRGVAGKAPRLGHRGIPARRLIGLGFSGLLNTVVHRVWRGAEPLSVQWILTAIEGDCLILGGLLGLSRLKSRSGETRVMLGKPIASAQERREQ